MGRIRILWLFLIFLAFEQTVAKKPCKYDNQAFSHLSANHCPYYMGRSDGNKGKKTIQHLSSSPYSAGNAWYEFGEVWETAPASIVSTLTFPIEDRVFGSSDVTSVNLKGQKASNTFQRQIWPPSSGRSLSYRALLDEILMIETLNTNNRTSHLDKYREGLRKQIQNKMDPSTKKANFLLYNEGIVNNMCPIVTGQPDTLESCAFNATLPLVMIVHGWSLDGTLEAWIPKMASAFKSSNKQINVIIVDWLSSAHTHYAVAVQNARFIGLEMAEFLEWLESYIQFPRSNVHLIGYSLGAHVSGFAGSYISGSDKIGRITGLDPAGPLFEGMSPIDRLSSDDANFVDAIHTNTQQHIGLSIGINERVGHYDFYPNGGDIQPGCQFRDLYSHIAEHGIHGFKKSVKCSHERSVHLFIESILNEDKQNIGYECKDVKTFEKGVCLKCPKSGCVTLGYNINKGGIRPRHSLFLKTRFNVPFKAYHYQIKMQVTNNIADKQLFPQLSTSLTGTKEDVNGLSLDISEGISETGTYSFLITLDTEIGDLMMMKLKWEASKDIKSLWYTLQKKMAWETLPGLLVKKIRVLVGETQERITFCAENADDFELHPDQEKNYVRCLNRLKRKEVSAKVRRNRLKQHA